jgi:hypothetical protein
MNLLTETPEKSKPHRQVKATVNESQHVVALDARSSFSGALRERLVLTLLSKEPLTLTAPDALSYAYRILRRHRLSQRSFRGQSPFESTC